ncbi:PQQ-dependent sugar dehydrogenase [Undibacterium sp. TS12]|uniref:PQQ-dependent sugar dehydrogenase n=1 Tax=Undibacterium sp. TS12 TaxID=2908202 RepID=UPI001F4CE7F4|nr:PQQ-dependent sugar dehydrogenase [Undibacterium sp. TS12]
MAETGLPFDHAPKGGRVLKVNEDGSVQELLSQLRQPVNGLVWHEHGLIISEGGFPGRISRYDLATGECKTLLDNLPGFGNYHTNMVAIGPDNKMYFGQGAMTNSGVIGADSHDLAWLREIRHEADIPGYDITLSDYAATVTDPEGRQISTGAFATFGHRHVPGTRLAGQTPATACIMRCQLDGSELELVAWGIRNAFGLLFLPDGRLIATEQGTDVRGVRPVWNCPDFLFEIKPGAWYGWPDYLGGKPINAPVYRSPQGVAQEFILANHADLPAVEKPLLAFDVNACAVKMVQVPARFERAGDLIVAQFGDERPMTGPPGPPVGRNLVRVDTSDWSLHQLPVFPWHRPIDIAFSPDGEFVYVVDFGDFEFTAKKDIVARARSGGVWKIPADYLELKIMSPVSFEKDIAPLFNQFRASMMWRLDLCKYDDVRINADMILSQIDGGGMPPSPYPPLTSAQITMFQDWMKQGYPR